MGVRSMRVIPVIPHRCDQGDDDGPCRYDGSETHSSAAPQTVALKNRIPHRLRTASGIRDEDSAHPAST